MALLTNINGKFSVSDAGAVRFNDAFTFPTSDGTLNYFLQTNGSGQLAWAAGPTGTVKGTGAATRVAFWSANDTISSSADLYWDNTNKRLGIGVAAPAALLEINGTGDAIRVESENTGAGGAQVDLLHFSPSPADNDTMGYINMGGYYSGTSSAYFSSIRTVATDISAREGEIQFWTVDTTLKQRMVIDKNGNVGIGNEGTGVVLTGKGLGIQNIGQDTTASMRLTGHNATGNPGVATFTELKHYGEFLSFGINHNGGTDVMTISPSKQVTFSGLVSGVTPTAAANFATKAYVDSHGGGVGPFLPLSAGVTKPLTGDLYINSSLYFGGANERIYMNGGGATNWRGVEVNSSGLWSWGETGIGNYFSRDISIGVTSFDHEINIHKAQAQGPIISLKETTTLNGSAEGGPCNDLGRIQWQSADTSTSQGGLVRGVIRVRPGECAYGTGGVIDIGTLDTYTGTSTSAWQVRMQIESNGLVRHKFSTELGTTANAVTNQFTTRVAGYGVLDSGTGNRYGSYGWINLHATTNYTGGARQYAITNAYKANKFAILVGGTIGSGGSAPTLTAGGEVGSGTSLGLCIDGTGVGIGTGAPSAIFHVSGNSYLLGAGYGIYGNADAANYHIKGSSSGSQLIVKWYSGVLWQGNGTTNIMQIENTGDLTVKGDVVAYGSPSDKRLKENIKPIESALDKAMKLQGVTFDWKKQKQSTEKSVKREWKHDVGFIAQDVQKVIPELVRENDNGMLSMRHQGIAPILLEAIKELKAEIEELKKQIK